MFLISLISGYLGCAPVHWSSNACSVISSRRSRKFFSSTSYSFIVFFMPIFSFNSSIAAISFSTFSSSFLPYTAHQICAAVPRISDSEFSYPAKIPLYSPVSERYSLQPSDTVPDSTPDESSKYRILMHPPGHWPDRVFLQIP